MNGNIQQGEIEYEEVKTIRTDYFTGAGSFHSGTAHGPTGKNTAILADMQIAIAGEALPDLYKYLASQKQDEKSVKVFFTESGPTALAKSLPGLYEFLVLKWRNAHENIRWLESAYQLRPDDPETYDDNDTFPIWVLQRAKGIRPDVTVLNVHLIKLMKIR